MHNRFIAEKIWKSRRHYRCNAWAWIWDVLTCPIPNCEIITSFENSKGFIPIKSFYTVHSKHQLVHMNCGKKIDEVILIKRNTLSFNTYDLTNTQDQKANYIQICYIYGWMWESSLYYRESNSFIVIDWSSGLSLFWWFGVLVCRSDLVCYHVQKSEQIKYKRNMNK